MKTRTVATDHSQPMGLFILVVCSLTLRKDLRLQHELSGRLPPLDILRGTHNITAGTHHEF
jgi:hypothetical protein